MKIRDRMSCQNLDIWFEQIPTSLIEQIYRQITTKYSNETSGERVGKFGNKILWLGNTKAKTKAITEGAKKSR